MTRRRPSKLRLISDQAIGEGDNIKKDGLGFATYARIIADAAVGTPGPFTIGIFGEWGTGKTSLLNLIQNNLLKESDVITVWFNAWRFEQDDHPIVPLIATIIKELDRNRTILAKMKDGGKGLIKALRAVAYGFSAKSTIKVPGFAEIEASFVAKDMIDRSDKLTHDPLLDKSLYYEAFESLSKIESETAAKIVVLIDDLDRCMPSKAVKVLESIKLALAQPGFIFIIGVARSVIEGYLQFKYKKQYGIDGFEGQAYLDKIVQLPFYLPPHDERIKDFTNDIIGQIEFKDKKSLREISSIIGAACGNNPRATIRFYNNLLIDCAIYKEISDEAPGRIIGYFAISRALQQRWGNIYYMLISSEELCKKISEWGGGSKLIEACKSSDVRENSIANSVANDMHLKTLLLSDYGIKWLKDKGKRTSATRFLETQRGDRKTEEMFYIKKSGSTFNIEKDFYSLVIYTDNSTDDRNIIAKRLMDKSINVISMHIEHNGLIPLSSAFNNTLLFLMANDSDYAKCANIIRILPEGSFIMASKLSGIILPGSLLTPSRIDGFSRIFDFSRGIDNKGLDDLVNYLSILHNNYRALRIWQSTSESGY